MKKQSLYTNVKSKTKISFKYGAVVQSLSHAWVFATPMDCNVSGFPVLHYLPEFTQTMSIELMMLSNNLILCHTFLLASGSFPMNQLFSSGGQSVGTSASASVLPMNIQGWFPLGLTGLISLQSK